MLELGGERDIPLPATTAGGLAETMRVRRAMSLEAYLEGFAVTLSLMQDAAALERIASELVADHADENVTYVELRFCPALCTELELTSPDVLDSVLHGLDGAAREHGVAAGVIVCALRSRPPSESLEMAELAIAYRDRGVWGLDLAGAEAGHPVHEHAEALRAAARAGLPVTIHAGEGYGPASIREALDVGAARRIGHGTRLGEDPDLLAAVRDAGIPLEICLTSNVQTGVVADYETHPLRRYVEAGIRACLCTDNRLMSGVTLTREYEHARDALGFSWGELVSMARTGFECAFAPDDVRSVQLERFESALVELV